jgi:hypothetical protein
VRRMRAFAGSEDVWLCARSSAVARGLWQRVTAGEWAWLAICSGWTSAGEPVLLRSPARLSLRFELWHARDSAGSAKTRDVTRSYRSRRRRNESLLCTFIHIRCSINAFVMWFL